MDCRRGAHSVFFTVLLFAARVTGAIDPVVPPSKANSSAPDERTNEMRVAIIGAGFAGLAAFQRLREVENPAVHVEIFEAADRVGGRVFPVEFEDGFLQHGAQFINGNANSIFRLAERLGVVDEEVDDDEFFRSADYRTGTCQIQGAEVEEFESFVAQLEAEYRELSRDSSTWSTTVGFLYRRAFEEFLKRKLRTQTEERNLKALSRFYCSYYESEWSAPIDRLSLMNYAKWNDRSDKFASYTLDKRGFAAIRDHLAAGIPPSSLHLGTKITRIDYSEERTRLQLANGSSWPTEFDFVGFGSLLKVFFVYDEPFWSTNSSESFVPLFMRGCGAESPLSHQLHTFEPLDWRPNVLVGWLSGDGPRAVDGLSDEQLAAEITAHFQAMNPHREMPAPRRLLRTSWLSDDNFRGAYTFITPEAAALSANPIELLARPVYYEKRPRNTIHFLPLICPNIPIP
ncbi:Spermine oxidase [Aphelenchoides fujianensis]|nr:Spermine oxidase [Aphelenchoides fujianensis]